MNLSIDNQGNRIKQRIVEYVTKVKHSGRRGSPEIPAGTKLYLVEYENGGYYTYSYVNRIDAEKSIENSRFYNTDTEFYREWNLVMDPEKTLHYGKVIK